MDIEEALIKQAKLHKALCVYQGIYFCVDCGGVEGLESDHLFPKSNYPQYQLELSNLALRCGQNTVKRCNQVKAQKVYHDFRTYKFWISFNFKRAVIGSIWPTILSTGFYYGYWIY